MRRQRYAPLCGVSITNADVSRLHKDLARQAAGDRGDATFDLSVGHDRKKFLQRPLILFTGLGTRRTPPVGPGRPGRDADARRRNTRRSRKRATQIVVLSASRAAAYEPSGHEVCISINDPKSHPITLSSRFADVLRLSFSDIAAPSPFSFHELFGIDHATAIIEFVDRWPDIDRIVVHCVAGLSRSPAVALAIAELRGMPTSDLERQYPLWNTWVRQQLLAAGVALKTAPRPARRRR